MFVLETNCVSDVQKGETSDSPIQTKQGEHIHEVQHPGLVQHAFLANELPSLDRLRQSLAHGAEGVRPLKHLLQPITFQAVEMLEAELLNQRILLKRQASVQTIAQQLAHEAGIWTWRALRLGIPTDAIRFEVHLPQYLLSKGSELISSIESLSVCSDDSIVHSPSSQTKSKNLAPALTAQLQYLNLFAAYLTGKYENTDSRYQRGLNLVLKTLCNVSGSWSIPSSPQPWLIQLPITLRKFMLDAKSYKEMTGPLLD